MNVTVRRGDSLWAISQAHDVSLKALIAANPQIANPSLIFPGQKVRLPKGARRPGDGFDDPKPKRAERSGDGFDVPKPKPGSARRWQARAVEHPKSIFKTQFRSRFNPTGPWRSSNCGPASLAMAVKAFGLEPDGLTPEQSIDRVRRLMTGNTNDFDATTDRERLRGARRAGLEAEPLGGPKNLDAHLAKGHMVTLTGRPVGAYRSAFPSYSSFDGWHSILVVGKRSDGRYVVADPLSHHGPRLLTRAQLAAFWSRGGGSGTAVWAVRR